MWSDDESGNTFVSASGAGGAGGGVTASATSYVSGQLTKFSLEFKHSGQLPPADDWFAVLWAAGELPLQAADASDITGRSHSLDITLSSFGGVDEASFELTLPQPGVYQLIVGYTGPAPVGGKYNDFGAIVVT